jgi:hypothetical protein
VIVTSNQSSSDIFGYCNGRNIVVNPTFSYEVNISNLTNGYHKIVITADLHMSGSYTSFTASSTPVQFLVQNPKPSPTPISAIGALISPVNITIIVTVVVLAVIAISLLVYRRRRKQMP